MSERAPLCMMCLVGQVAASAAGAPDVPPRIISPTPVMGLAAEQPAAESDRSAQAGRDVCGAPVLAT